MSDDIYLEEEVIDFKDEATDLLSKIANSLHDRDPKNPNPVFFSSQEMEVVTKWLANFCSEQFY